MKYITTKTKIKVPLEDIQVGDTLESTIDKANTSKFDLFVQDILEHKAYVSKVIDRNQPSNPYLEIRLEGNAKTRNGGLYWSYMVGEDSRKITFYRIIETKEVIKQSRFNLIDP